jgi:hypothetical protein
MAAEAIIRYRLAECFWRKMTGIFTCDFEVKHTLSLCLSLSLFLLFDVSSRGKKQYKVHA